RHLPDAFGEPVRLIPQLGDLFLNGGAGVRELALETTDADGQRGHLLVQIVMQLTRDVSALFFLGDNQASGKVFNPGVAFAQLLLTPAQRLFGLLALGNVNDQAAHFQTPSAFVVNGLASPFHPAHAPVRPDDAVLTSILSLLLNRSSYRSHRDLQVIRVHPVGPGAIVLRRDTERLQAHDRVMLFGPPGGIVPPAPPPAPPAPRFEREPQTFFALAPLPLDLFEFGDITPDSLKFDDLTARVQDRMVNPLLPADGAVGKQRLVLVYLHTWVLD